MGIFHLSHKEKVERYVVIDRAITALKAEHAELRADLIDKVSRVEETFVGFEHALTIVYYQSKRLDMDAVHKKLSPQFVRAHTTVVPAYRFTVADISVAKAA